MLTKTSCW